MSGPGRLEGRTAIITGAGGGIGLAYARRFLREGARVVIAELRVDRGEAAAEQLAGLGEVMFVATDVTDPASIERCVRQTVDRFAGIDILINNAALYGGMDGKDWSYEYLLQAYEINLHSIWKMTDGAGRYLTASPYGRVINQSSGAAYNYVNTGSTDDSEEFHGVATFTYSQTKYGVIGLTKYMAGQLGRWGVTVNCIAPGVIDTEATRSQVSPEILQRLGDMQPVRGRITADEVAGTAVYFAGDDARFVTGQVVVVDGGRHMPA